MLSFLFSKTYQFLHALILFSIFSNQDNRNSKFCKIVQLLSIQLINFHNVNLAIQQHVNLKMPTVSSQQCTCLSQSVQWVSHVQIIATPWTEARHASLSITNSWSLLKLMSVESVMPSNYLIFIPFSRLQSFPASGSFQMSQFFTSGGQIHWTCFFSLWTPKLHTLGLPRYVIRTCGMWFESPQRDFLSSMCAIPCLLRVFSMELMLDGYITVQLELFL